MICSESTGFVHNRAVQTVETRVDLHTVVVTAERMKVRRLRTTRGHPEETRPATGLVCHDTPIISRTAGTAIILQLLPDTSEDLLPTPAKRTGMPKLNLVEDQCQTVRRQTSFFRKHARH